MRARRRTNLLAGLVGLAIALVLLAQGLGWLPAQYYDVLLRAWPALLVLAGLSLLLRGRVPFGAGIALVVTLALVGAVAVAGFSSRGQEQREDYREIVTQPVNPTVGLLRVRLNTLATDVELLRSVTPDLIAGEFVGSSESQVTVAYDEPGDGSATLTLSEARPSPLPMLDAVGRGALRLELPTTVPLDIELQAADGDVTLNMGETAVERMNLDLVQGDAVVTLPGYHPIAAAEEQSQGTLAVRDGDITLVVPASVAARLELDRGGSGVEPEYDPSMYNFLFNRVLEARTIEQAETVLRYNVVAPHGHIRLEVSEAAA